MQHIDIRVCQASDLPAARGLLLQLTEVAHETGFLDPERLQELFDELSAQPDMYLNLVAESGGQVVGFISVVFYKTLFHRGGTALINELVVDRGARGMGIGRALVERVVAEARARGMDEVEVGTEQSNQRAKAFYRGCGFDEEYVLLGMEFA